MELYSVIKNESVNHELVWLSDKEDFNNHTQLIVMESEEALFVKDGVVVESFPGGKYTLNTENYPVIEKLRKSVSGGESAFNCKVYFVDKTHKLELFWGTDSPIQMKDAEYGFAVGVRARGSYSIEVNDTKKFLIKLVGLNTKSFTEEDLQSKFRTVFQSKIKVTISKVMKACRYTILDMNTELENIGELVETDLGNVLDEYGVRLVNFYVSDISIPENDPNYKTINEAYAKAHAGKIEYDVQGAGLWEKLTAKELSKDVANNPNSGGIAAAGAGIGMGIAAGGLFNGLGNQLFSPLANGETTTVEVKATQKPSRFAPKTEKNESTNKEEGMAKCPNCGNMVAKTSKFCGNCGNKMSSDWTCPTCGKMVSASSKFCGECGTKRSED